MAGPRPRRRRLVAALVATLAVALGACSSGGGLRGNDAATELPSDARDRAIVQAGVLKLMDFPAGWAIDEDEDAPDEELDKIDESIPECRRVRQTNDATSLGQAESPDFVSTIDAQAGNNVEIYPDAAKVDEMQSLAVSPDSVACLQQGLRVVMNLALARDPQTAAVTGPVEVTGGPVAVPQYGDGAVGLNFEATVSSAGSPVTFYFELVAVKVGRTQASYRFMDDLLHPAADVQAQVIEATVARLRAAGA